MFEHKKWESECYGKRSGETWSRQKHSDGPAIVNRVQCKDEENYDFGSQYSAAPGD